VGFLLLFLLPGLSMLGYLAGLRVGAVAYNLAHVYAVPAALGGIAPTAWPVFCSEAATDAR